MEKRERFFETETSGHSQYGRIKVTYKFVEYFGETKKEINPDWKEVKEPLSKSGLDATFYGVGDMAKAVDMYLMEKQNIELVEAALAARKKELAELKEAIGTELFSRTGRSGVYYTVGPGILYFDGDDLHIYVVENL